jgi:hypothetical protein
VSRPLPGPHHMLCNPSSSGSPIRRRRRQPASIRGLCPRYGGRGSVRGELVRQHDHVVLGAQAGFASYCRDRSASSGRPKPRSSYFSSSFDARNRLPPTAPLSWLPRRFEAGCLLLDVPSGRLLAETVENGGEPPEGSHQCRAECDRPGPTTVAGCDRAMVAAATVPVSVGRRHAGPAAAWRRGGARSGPGAPAGSPRAPAPRAPPARSPRRQAQRFPRNATVSGIFAAFLPPLFSLLGPAYTGAPEHENPVQKTGFRIQSTPRQALEKP